MQPSAATPRSRCTSTTCSSTRPAPTAPRSASATSTRSGRTRSRTPGWRSPPRRVRPRVKRQPHRSEVPPRRRVRYRSRNREHRAGLDRVDRPVDQDDHARPSAGEQPRRRRGRGHRVHPLPLVRRRVARQHLLARPRRRHPRLGPWRGRHADRRAEELDLPRPDHRRRSRFGHRRRHPLAPRADGSSTRWPRAWSTAASARWSSGPSTTTR